MITRALPIRFQSISLIALVLGLAPVAQGSTGSATNAPAKPSGVAADPALPQSAFVMPRSSTEGRDPFFPHSNRPYTTFQPLVKVETNAAPTISADLKLKGISGSSDKPLALINNHTFEAGEEADILSGLDRIRIRCLEIRKDSVLIQIGPERRELRMRSGI